MSDPKHAGTSPDPAAEPEAGSRSGAGARSLWKHLTKDAQQKGASVASESSPIGDRAGFTVLVVDDEPAARYAIARALRAAGYVTLEAQGGAQGLELAEHASAVILDVHLPDLDGFEVCRLLRSRPGTVRVPIIHVSAVYVEPQHRETAVGAGADAYYVSPVAPEELIEAVDKLIAGRQARSS